VAKKDDGAMETILTLLKICLALSAALVLYPVWRLFAWTANAIGTSWIRRAGDRIETPVVFYVHPETKREVVLITTIHYAEPEYYAGIQKLIDALGNHRILFEGVGKITEEETTSLTEDERRVLRKIVSSFRLMDVVAVTLSLQKQRDGLAYPTHWINTDVKLIELVRWFAKNKASLIGNVLEPSNANPTDVEMPEPPIIKWLFDRQLGQIIPIAMVTNVIAFFSKPHRLAVDYILRQRNEIALAGIEERLRTENVATIWGAGHLPGIDAGLKKLGFREVRRAWHVAYHVRNYSLIEAVEESKRIPEAKSSVKKQPSSAKAKDLT
jgi:hypothetical protein